MTSPPLSHVPWGAPLVRGRFLRRYKRFFVDVDMDGVVHTTHTANTGAMTGLLLPGAPVLLTRHDGGKRAYPLELEAIHVGESWCACNTIRSNRVAEALVRGGAFPELGPILDVAREVPLGHHRVDMRVDGPGGSTLLEVKSVTLRDGETARFPDAPSERASSHVQALARAARRGQRAAILLLVQRTDCARTASAPAVDPTFARALWRARDSGVVLLSAAVAVDELGISLAARLPVELEAPARAAPARPRPRPARTPG